MATHYSRIFKAANVRFAPDELELLEDLDVPVAEKLYLVADVRARQVTEAQR